MSPSKTRGSALRAARRPRIVPRNPLATAARRRAAGAHGPSGKAQRSAARRALKKALDSEDDETVPPP